MQSESIIRTGQFFFNPRHCSIISRLPAAHQARWHCRYFQVEQTRFEATHSRIDAKDVYTVEARHPITGKLLGYIRYADGTLELTNFDAQLKRSTLDIGESSKQGNSQAAGMHGEGYKWASLVMVRNNYRVHYEASEFYWNTSFKHGALYCILNPMVETKPEEQIKALREKVAEKVPRELDNNIWEDVSVQLGKVSPGKKGGTAIEKVDSLSGLRFQSSWIVLRRLFISNSAV